MGENSKSNRVAEYCQALFFLSTGAAWRRAATPACGFPVLLQDFRQLWSALGRHTPSKEEKRGDRQESYARWHWPYRQHEKPPPSCIWYYRERQKQKQNNRAPGSPTGPPRPVIYIGFPRLDGTGGKQGIPTPATCKSQLSVLRCGWGIVRHPANTRESACRWRTNVCSSPWEDILILPPADTWRVWKQRVCKLSKYSMS